MSRAHAVSGWSRPLALLAVVTTVVATGGCARAGGDAFQATVTDALPAHEEPVGQTFTPGADRIAGVDLLTATFRERPDPDGELVVALVDHDAGETVATAEVPAEVVDDSGWVPARFDEPASPPPNPAFTVEWTGDSTVGVWANVPPPDVDGDERLINDPYPGGQLLRGGQPATGDLAFRVVGDVGVAEPLRALARLAGGAVLALAAVPWFGVLWGLMFAGAVALAVAGFRAARRG